jgi:two-component system, NtrC family, sensor histidine kinase AtoS
MNAHIHPAVLFGVVVIAAGGFILWSLARRYRRELGLGEGAQEKERTEDLSFIINAFHDVNLQLKEKEKELQRLKALAEQRAETVASRTENILQCVSNGVVTFDTAGTVTTMNRAAEEILGIAREQALGKTCRELFDQGDLCRLVQDALENRVTARRMEAALLRGQGRIWLGFNTALLTDKDGSGLGVILSFSDLTDVKRLQEQVELKERLSALGEMSAGIAHELRNPMAVIAGYLKLLAKQEDPKGRAIIADIQTEISGMNRIIGDLLTFARPTALNRTAVDLRELVNGCLESALQARSESAAVRTVVRVPPATVWVDEVLMRQALGNILQNAADAMPDGGTLTVEAGGERGEAVVISDTGAGIPQENLKRIFLPFFTTREKGVGMGLALAHKIVTAHGGRIEVESREGAGTAFSVFLPQG